MFRDFLQVVQASFGRAIKVTLDLATGYYVFLKKAIWPSAIAIAAGSVAFWLSEIVQVALLNTIGVLVWGLVFLFWFVAAQPIVVLADQLGSMYAPIKRLFDRVITVLLVVVVLVIAISQMPAGVAGQKQLFILMIFMVGAMLLGYQITKRAIGVKLVLMATLMAASVFLPRTFSSMSTIGTAIDIGIFNKFVPSANQLDVSLTDLTGENPNAPRLFVDGRAAWWCRRDNVSETGYMCFDLPGEDAVTNEPLTPINPEIVAEMKDRLLFAQAEANREAEQKRQRNIDTARAKALAERQRNIDSALAKQQRNIDSALAKQQAYRDKYTARPNTAVQLGISISNGQRFDSEVFRAINKHMSKKSTGQVLLDAAIVDGVFDRLFEGNKGEYGRLQLGEITKQLLLGRVEIHLSENKAIRGVVNAQATLTLRLMDAFSGSIVNSVTSSVTALGYSAQEARQVAIGKLADAAAAELDHSH